jgi:uncharacterized membrane protein YccC
MRPEMGGALRTGVPALLFGLRLAASVCLSLYIALWLQLDNPYWAAVSAAAVSQPSLGASLRKGWYRMIGTLVGAVFIVVLTAWVADRFGLLRYVWNPPLFVCGVYVIVLATIVLSCAN